MSALTKFQSQDEDKQLQLIIDTYCKGATQEEAALFSHICKRTGLDPAAKQIYAVKRKDTKLGREVMTIQTGIDGYRLIAERTGCYCPGREPTYAYDKDGKLVSATSYVKKMTRDGTWHEVAATAYYDEYAQKTAEYVDGKRTGKMNPTKFWDDMPHSQLSKCAEALALRKAFPTDLSGLYTKEEMNQASNGAEISNVKPLYIEKSTITSQQAIELSELLNQCDPEVKKNAIKFVQDKFKIEMIDDLPSDEFERYKALFSTRAAEYQKKLAEAEMLNVNAETGEVIE